MTLLSILGSPGVPSAFLSGGPDAVEMAALRARSPYLLNAKGSLYLPGVTAGDVQVDRPGMRQPFPTTAADLLVALGSPVGWTAANVLAIYACDTASPLVDSLGLGPNLVAAGGPLTGRECVGLPGTSFNSKVGVEFPVSGSLFADAGHDFMDVGAGEIRSVLLIFRTNEVAAPNYGFTANKRAFGTNWWQFLANTSSIYASGLTTGAVVPASVACSSFDGAWHCAAASFNDVAKTIKVFTDLGDDTSGSYTGSMSGIGSFSLGTATFTATNSQIAYVACLNLEITSAMRATFWRAFQSAGLGTPNTYARTNPLVVPISAHRVACYGAGQLAVGYDAGFSTDGNALQTGIVAEDAITWLGLGTTNQPAWVGTNATNAAADGPSGMRDSARVQDADGVNAGYVTTGSANLAGATNVPFQFAAWRQAVGGGGLNAVYRAYFTGDGGGPEELTWATDAGTVPASFGRIVGNCTPVGAAHTAVVVRLYPTDAVPASLGTVDFYLEGGVQNRNTDWLAHRRAAAGATSATSTPSESITNVGNRRYSPIRGRIHLKLSNFQGTSGAFFVTCGAAGAAGALTLSYNAGQLILRAWDSAAALVATVNCGAIDTAEHSLDVLWDARVPINGSAASSHLLVKEGATILGEGGAAWTPPTADVTPIYVGCNNLGSAAARALISDVVFSSLPGSVYD